MAIPPNLLSGSTGVFYPTSSGVDPADIGNAFKPDFPLMPEAAKLDALRSAEPATDWQKFKANATTELWQLITGLPMMAKMFGDAGVEAYHKARERGEGWWDAQGDAWGKVATTGGDVIKMLPSQIWNDYKNLVTHPYQEFIKRPVTSILDVTALLSMAGGLAAKGAGIAAKGEGQLAKAAGKLISTEGRSPIRFGGEGSGLIQRAYEGRNLYTKGKQMLTDKLLEKPVFAPFAAMRDKSVVKKWTRDAAAKNSVVAQKLYFDEFKAYDRVLGKFDDDMLEKFTLRNERPTVAPLESIGVRESTAIPQDFIEIGRNGEELVNTEKYLNQWKQKIGTEKAKAFDDAVKFYDEDAPAFDLWLKNKEYIGDMTEARRQLTTLAYDLGVLKEGEKATWETAEQLEKIMPQFFEKKTMKMPDWTGDVQTVRKGQRVHNLADGTEAVVDSAYQQDAWSGKAVADLSDTNNTVIKSIDDYDRHIATKTTQGQRRAKVQEILQGKNIGKAFTYFLGHDVVNAVYADRKANRLGQRLEGIAKKIESIDKEQDVLFGKMGVSNPEKIAQLKELIDDPKASMLDAVLAEGKIKGIERRSELNTERLLDEVRRLDEKKAKYGIEYDFVTQELQKQTGRSAAITTGREFVPPVAVTTNRAQRLEKLADKIARSKEPKVTAVDASGGWVEIIGKDADGLLVKPVVARKGFKATEEAPTIKIPQDKIDLTILSKTKGERRTAVGETGSPTDWVAFRREGSNDVEYMAKELFQKQFAPMDIKTRLMDAYRGNYLPRTMVADAARLKDNVEMVLRRDKPSRLFSNPGSLLARELPTREAFEQSAIKAGKKMTMDYAKLIPAIRYQIREYDAALQTIRDVAKMAIPAEIVNGVAVARKGYKLFQPSMMSKTLKETLDSLIQVHKKLDDGIDIGTTMDDLINSLTDVEKSDSLYNRLMKDALPEASAGENVLQIPVAAANTLNDIYLKTDGVMQFFNKHGMGKWLVAYDASTDIFRDMVLGKSPRWMVNNIIGNVILSVLSGNIGALSPKNMIRAKKAIAEGIVPEAVIGKTMAQSYSGLAPMRHFKDTRFGPVFDSIAAHPIYQKYLDPILNGIYTANTKAEQQFRAALYVYKGMDEASKLAVTQSARGFGEAAHLAEWAKDFEVLRGHPEFVTKYANAVNDVLFDYTALSAFERSVMRRILPFYSWTKNITKFFYEMPRRNPVIAATMNQLAVIAADAVRNDDEPDYLKTALKMFSDDATGEATFWQLQSKNPMEAAFFPFQVGADYHGLKRQFAGLNPWMKTFIELILGESLFTGKKFRDRFFSERNMMTFDPVTGEAIESRGASKNFGEALMENFPQYMMVKNWVAPYRVYDTATLPQLAWARIQASRGDQAAFDKFLIPQKDGSLKEVPFERKLLSFFAGIGMFDTNLKNIAEGRKRNVKASVGEWFRKISDTETEWNNVNEFFAAIPDEKVQSYVRNPRQVIDDFRAGKMTKRSAQALVGAIRREGRDFTRFVGEARRKAALERAMQSTGTIR